MGIYSDTLADTWLYPGQDTIRLNLRAQAVEEMLKETTRRPRLEGSHMSSERIIECDDLKRRLDASFENFTHPRESRFEEGLDVKNWKLIEKSGLALAKSVVVVVKERGCGNCHQGPIKVPFGTNGVQYRTWKIQKSVAPKPVKCNRSKIDCNLRNRREPDRNWIVSWLPLRPGLRTTAPLAIWRDCKSGNQLQFPREFADD
ncbi:hypothetical protein DFH09DRAFT_1068723 [Mycena vulgaris]|nr:hypothetical protein DFH09DRAFT_1068723 [Mycena vulgaris]